MGEFDSPHYGTVLAACYDHRAEPPAGVLDPVRFALERDRRILDVARLLSLRWPRTCRIAQGRVGDAFILDVAALIPRYINQAEDIASAVALAARQWIKDCLDDVIAALFDFETARAGDLTNARAPSPEERTWLADIDIDVAAIIDLNADVLMVVETLDFLIARAAPAYLLRAIGPGEAASVALFSRGARKLAVTLPRANKDEASNGSRRR